MVWASSWSGVPGSFEGQIGICILRMANRDLGPILQALDMASNAENTT